MIDPFGGTGADGRGRGERHILRLSQADSDSIACLTARARLTYLPRPVLGNASGSCQHKDLFSHEPAKVAAQTATSGFATKRLTNCRITGFIQLRRIILGISCLRVLDHNYPPLRQSERRGCSPTTHLPARNRLAGPARCRVAPVKQNWTALNSFTLSSSVTGELRKRNFDVSLIETTLTAAIELVVDGGAAAIITSPPYLCMGELHLDKGYHIFICPESLPLGYFRRGAGVLGVDRRTLHRYLAKLDGFTTALAGRTAPPEAFSQPSLLRGSRMSLESAELLAKSTVCSGMVLIVVEQGFTPINWHRNRGFAQLKGGGLRSMCGH